MRVVRLLFFVALIAAGAYVVWDNNRDPAETAAPVPSVTSAPPTATKPTPAPSAIPSTPHPPAGSRVSTTLRKSVALLKVVPEDRQAYTRTLFGKGWADLDKDCQDTRAEVLARDSRIPVAKGCRVLRGKWVSYYDNKTWTKSFQVQIDHLVPLAEAWDSGAFAWNAATRINYANDLGSGRTLVPTTTALNYAKLADDPQWYIPKVNACRYISSWIAVKLRWTMTVDKRERDAIAKVVKICPNTALSVTRAKRVLLPFAAGTGTASRAIRIESISYRGKAEKIVLRNAGQSTVTLRGWVVTDEIGYGQFRMPLTQVSAGKAITIVSTAGKSRTNSNGNVIHYANWGDVWNNSGDTAKLIDGKRRMSDSCAYRGDDSGKATC